MGTRTNRISRLRRALDISPVRRAVLREAYGLFVEFGELPDDDDHVAYEVVQRALRGGEEEPPDDDETVAKRVKRARLAYHEKERPGDAWPPSVRAMLFDEALFEMPEFRNVARFAIRHEVTLGGDVESPGFCARHGIPTYGLVGMHVIGWPRTLVVPPYEHQANELLVRFDDIKARLPQTEQWHKQHHAMRRAFAERGEIPNDDLHLELLLADLELDQLEAHRRGKDVRKAMALLRRVAWREGGAQERALRRLCEMAKAGQLAGA